MNRPSFPALIEMSLPEGMVEMSLRRIPGLPGRPSFMPFQNTGVLMIDLNGRIAFASTFFCDVVGLEHDKVTGMSWFDFVFPEDMDEARRIFGANKLPHAEPFRFRLRRWNGGEVWTDTQGNAMQTASGKIYGVSATITLAEPVES